MTANPTSSDEELLVDYVRQALEARERGENVDPRVLCAAHPQLAADVAEILGMELSALREAGAADPRAGRVLGGRYRLDAPLGRGAMGVVYEATDQELGRVVAVKLFETLGRPQASDEARFLREAEALAALQHDHIVAIHDRGRDADGTLFLVMERLTGAPLSALMQLAEEEAGSGTAFVDWLGRAMGGVEGTPPETTWMRAAVHWCADVAAGLAAAHERGVLHRDVKPSNVFVRRDLRAVLLDFGIAAREGDPALTAGDSTLGTPWYMAPEQATGGSRSSQAIDVYGLSATLYHLLTGQPPLTGDAVQVVARLQNEDPRPPGRVRPGLPRDLCAIVEKGMERDPRNRYATVADLERDLRAFLAHQPVVARPLTRIGRFVRRVRQRPARAIALGASLVAAVLLVVVVPLWSVNAAHDRAEEKAELVARLPALLAIEGELEQRMLQSLAERAESLALLDRILELDPDDLPHRLWRAALRVDQGEHEGAAEDLREIVRRAGDSDYVRAVAQRYLDADVKKLGTAAIELGGLPEPTTTFDKFIAGFHELRNRHVPGFGDRAFELLDDVAEEYPPARELRLIAMLYLGEIRRDGALLRRVIDDSRWLEGHYGRKTARTHALRGAALLLLGQFEAAVRDLLAADELRPGRHGPLHNLGVAYRRLGEHAKAEDYFERAHAVRPHFWNTTYMLGLLHVDRGNYDRAFQLADRLAAHLPEVQEWREPELRASIYLRRAIARRERGAAPGEIRSDAEAATSHFDAALELVTSPRVRQKLEVRRGVARYLSAEDASAAVAAMLEVCQLTPDDPYEISNLATLLPNEGLDEASTAALRAWMRRLSIVLAKGDPAFRSLVQAQLARENNR